jgi:hypothetical protein
MRGAIPPLPNKSSWRGALLSTVTLPLLFLAIQNSLSIRVTPIKGNFRLN